MQQALQRADLEIRCRVYDKALGMADRKKVNIHYQQQACMQRALRHVQFPLQEAAQAIAIGESISSGP